MKARANKRSFALGLILLCGLYLCFEIFFNRYAMLSVDEFWFAHRIYQYKNGLPYKDFAPYKTVLGYYLFLLPMLIKHGIWQTLILMKNMMALINTCILFFSAWWLRRYFSTNAILSSLALLISSEIVLCYSTNIRVDLFSYWFCFFSLLFLLENRYRLAGLLLGLGFITSQKAIWYVFASHVALSFRFFNHEHKLKFISKIIEFDLVIFSFIFGYLLLWSAVADYHTVIQSVFYEASAMYHLDWYDHARKLYWTIITLYNPLLFLLWPLTCLSVFITYSNDTHYQARLFVNVYAICILLCLIPYKQVFPYYMQVTIPIFFLLYASFFDWLLKLFSGMDPAIKSRDDVLALSPRTCCGVKSRDDVKEQKFKFLLPLSCLWLLLISYILTIIWAFVSFNLPDAYLFICLIPLLLAAYLCAHDCVKNLTSLFFNLIVITLLFVGVIYPLTSFVIKIINLDGSYQKANIRVINRLLKDGSDYVAGIELIYNKDQPIAGMRHLMGPAIDYLYNPSDNIRPVMLASLYADPNATVHSVIEALKKSNVKFYVNNYRMMALPKPIKHFLHYQYKHWWGSIYLYAPKFSAGTHHVYIKFCGQYLIHSCKANEINIDAHVYKNNQLIYLEKGWYDIETPASVRLRLQPQAAKFYLDKQFIEDEWGKIIF